MNTTDLRRLAEAATPGSMHRVMPGGNGGQFIAFAESAEFYAAASPAVVLALLDVVDRVRDLRDTTHLIHDTGYETDPLWHALYALDRAMEGEK
jgi:hypothetical protein